MAIDKDKIRRKRNAAVTANLGIESGDEITTMISRDDGLYMVTLEKIIRVNLPDDIDPEMNYEDAPTTQTLIIGKGSRHPLIARTILQAEDFSAVLAGPKRKIIQDIAWEVMLSLLAFERSLKWLRDSIEAKQAEISEKYELYVSGSSPPPVPIVEGVEIEFRSIVLIANHALNAISELFPALFDASFRRGRFDQIITWSNKTFGAEDPLSRMLEGDHRWIYLWGEVRNAFEHPTKRYYVKVNNFRLLANRQIQLPTWQLQHPKLDVFRPQRMIDTLELHQNNILGFFENLLLELTNRSAEMPVPRTN